MTDQRRTPSRSFEDVYELQSERDALVAQIPYRSSKGAEMTKPTIDECSKDPEAPHGFDRNASHSEGRYVCECEHHEAHKAIMEAKMPGPVAWLLQGKESHVFSFKKPTIIGSAVLEPLYGPDLLAYADRMRAEYLRSGGTNKYEGHTLHEWWERAITAERQLAELQAKHDALVRAAETTRPLSALDNAEDAERYRYLQNIAPKDAQAFFWNFNSRRQRSAAIDAARKESHD